MEMLAVPCYLLFTKAIRRRAGLVALIKSQSSSREGTSVGLVIRGQHQYREQWMGNRRQIN